MFEIICVTDRGLCASPFIGKIERIAEARPDALILREKSLCDDEYYDLAVKVKRICEKRGVKFIPHGHIAVARKLNSSVVQLPSGDFYGASLETRALFGTVGVSCHSAEEARKASEAGAGYVVFGHVFATDCKKGVSPRGTSQLENVIKAVDIPVYAIGGIGKENIAEVVRAGAKGACIMSGFMTCENVGIYLDELRNKIKNA